MKREKLNSRPLTRDEQVKFDMVAQMMTYVNEYGHLASEDTKNDFTMAMMASGIIPLLQNKYILTAEESDKLASCLQGLIDGIKKDIEGSAA